MTIFRSKYLILLALFSLPAGLAAQKADPKIGTYVTDDELLENCSAFLNKVEGLTKKESSCVNYVMGVIDMHDLYVNLGVERQFCIIGGDNFGNVIPQIVQSMKKDEATEKHYGSLAVLIALREIFPCNQSESDER